MKQQKKHKLLWLTVALLLVSMAAVTAIWAMLKESFGEQENTFTPEEIGAQITEPLWDGERLVNDSNYDEDEQYVIAEHRRSGPQGAWYGKKRAKDPEQQDNVDTLDPDDYWDYTNDAQLGMNVASIYTPGAVIPKNPSVANLSDITNGGDVTDPQEWMAMTAYYYIEGDDGCRYYFDGYEEFYAALATVNFSLKADHDLSSATKPWYVVNTSGAGDYTQFLYKNVVNNFDNTDPLFTTVTINAQSAFESLRVVALTEEQINDGATYDDDDEHQVGRYKFTGLTKTNAQRVVQKVTDHAGDDATDADVGHAVYYCDTYPTFYIDLKGYAVQKNSGDSAIIPAQKQTWLMDMMNANPPYTVPAGE